MVERRQYGTVMALAGLGLALVMLLGVAPAIGAPSAAPAASVPEFVPFSVAYGGTEPDSIDDVRETADGGYVVAGYTKSLGAGEADAWVLKLDGDGTVAWQKTYGGMDWEWAHAIEETADGGYVVAGYTKSFGSGDSDAWVLKLNEDGSVAWQKTYGGAEGDWAEDIRHTADGGYVVLGGTRISESDPYAVWVLKLNEDGSVAWQKTYTDRGWDVGYAIEETADGGYIVVGKTLISEPDPLDDVWVLKLKANGSVVWQKTYGGPKNEAAFGVQQTTDGGYIVVGWTESFGAGGWDAWVLKLKADGGVAWQKTYGGVEGDWAGDIRNAADGGYVVAGGRSFEGLSPAWALRLNQDGSVAWQRIYGTTGNYDFDAIQYTNDGGFIAGGRTTAFGAGIADAWVLRLNADGKLCPECPAESPTVTVADSTAATADSNVKTNNSNATVTDSDATVADTDVSPDYGCQCGLSICKNVIPQMDIARQSVVTYTVVLSKSAQPALNGVHLTDTLPSEVTFGGWLVRPSGAEVVDNELTWTGTVSTGQAITFTFTATHVGHYGDVVTNTAVYSHASSSGGAHVTFHVKGGTVMLPLVLRDD